MQRLCWGLTWGASVAWSACFLGSAHATEVAPFIEATSGASTGEADEAEATTIYAGRSMRLAVPTHPLARGSVKVMPLLHALSFSEWQPSQRVEAYRLMQRVARIWEEQGITDYMIFGKEAQSDASATHNASKSNLEMVPFPKNQWNTWQQFKMLWKIMFGAALLPTLQREREAQEMHSALCLEDDSKIVQETSEALGLDCSHEPFVRGRDAFCDPEVIKRQLIFEGKEVNLLYNYKPIEKLHFLITPKRHHVRFSDLTESEYIEATQISQKLMRFYRDHGYPIVYFYNKTGVMQTVPHWHEHVIFAASKTDAVFGEFMVLRKMLLPTWPLSTKEVQKRVYTLRHELKDVLERS